MAIEKVLGEGGLYTFNAAERDLYDTIQHGSVHLWLVSFGKRKRKRKREKIGRMEKGEWRREKGEGRIENG
jgi:hypothetical protein